MARRINAPGIEVNEIDRSQYDQAADNSTIGTATLALGFADKGEDYTVRWVNTMNTFVQNYGKPKTEAERYLYNAAYETVSRGGICYVAKLPYHNNAFEKFVYTSYEVSQEPVPIKTVEEIVGFGNLSDETIADYLLYPDKNTISDYLDGKQLGSLRDFVSYVRDISYSKRKDPLSGVFSFFS